MEQIRVINTKRELVEILDAIDTFKLYGAGYYLDIFLNGLNNIDREYFEKISCVMVSDTNGNAKNIRGSIPVMCYQDANIKTGEYIFLTLGKRFVNEIYAYLKDTGAVIIQIDFNIFQESSYHYIMKSIQPFIDEFPKCCLNLNMPETTCEVTAWTCWWQGEEHAPDIVKACLQSQRKNLPDGVRQVVVTEENYKDYIMLPNYIFDKVMRGDIMLATLSDMIRAALLYKYGGFWMDATLYLLKPLNQEIFSYPIYTRNLPETQFCSNAMWAGWFYYAKPGNKLFRFIEESFFYYFTVFDRAEYYLMIDYITAIACNIFPEIEKQLREVPYNNEKALELGKHLSDKYDADKYKRYVEGTSVQKLTYKVNLLKKNYHEETFYDYIIDAEKFTI